MPHLPASPCNQFIVAVAKCHILVVGGGGDHRSSSTVVTVLFVEVVVVVVVVLVVAAAPDFEVNTLSNRVLAQSM